MNGKTVTLARKLGTMGTLKVEEGMEEITFELSDKDLLQLALLAHEEDITLNQYIVNALTKYAKGIVDGAADSTDA